MSKLVLTGVGDVDTTVRLDVNPDLTLGATDALVTLEAAALNPADFLFALGWYGVYPQVPSAIGFEGVGRVAAVGAEVDQSLAGKRVIFLPVGTPGVWATQAVVPARNLVVVPDAADARQLAMLSVNPATAYLLLNRYVDLQPGDWIGQNIANSAVGQLVVALARRAGVKTLNVVRREEAAQQVRDLGGDVVLVDGEDLGDRVKAALGGAELKLVLDGAADATAATLATALSAGGTVVGYSSATGEPAKLPLGDVIYRELNHRGFWITNWARTASRKEVERVYGELAGLVVAGELGAAVEAVYSLEDFQAAFDHARKAGRAGKVLFTF
ncbi:zinc-dependent alcohol dehydrogenase family protein [Amycolatopsis rhabdoformis]|uniref:enoyl-[acyl-carrier-protein] reductase n=1 Tax=Amycolatopsis rhabdoformis TaxID=1448059 RepID=A0ABZ1I4Z6_9PSEU|nr:zinc-dependent alcohol dehydrogenase family protein [Amycolatopsis rhabdoformis]WSE28705.1 zinc-dependent alcohol dehydrogenase family protein [Amycolatopsis rhabdoformis]